MAARMRRIFQLIFICLLVLPSPALSDEKGLAVKGIRYFSYAAFTRIVFEIESAAPYVLTKTADGRELLFSAYDGPFVLKSPLPAIRDGVVSGMEEKEDAGKLFVVIRLDAAAGDVKDFVLRAPDRIVLDIGKGAAPTAPPAPDKPAVIMLDAGHGGRDTGMVTAQGQEKSITLDLALAVKKILQKNQYLKVVLTREKDLPLTLDERVAAANAAGSLVFVTIHAASGTGERIYIQDPDEDPRVQKQQPMSKDFLGYETGSAQQEKIWDRQQAGHAKESGALGRVLARQFGKDNAEPVQAPIAQLKPVDAAAVMIEVGMEQNRTRTAEAVAKGIELYVRENR